MEKKETEYTLKTTIKSEKATVRVFSPVITAEERARRMAAIHKAAARLLISAGK